MKSFYQNLFLLTTLLITVPSFANFQENSFLVKTSYQSDFTLLADTPNLVVFDFPEGVPILENACITSKESLSSLDSDRDDGFFIASCRNQEYCKSKNLEGTGKWICSPSGAGQPSKCFQCK